MKLTDKEQALEAEFAHNEDLRFKIRAHRNKLAGLWAAEKLGSQPEDSDSYAKAIVAQFFSKDQLITKLSNDFEEAGLNISDEEIEANIEEFERKSRNHFMFMDN